MKWKLAKEERNVMERVLKEAQELDICTFANPLQNIKKNRLPRNHQMMERNAPFRWKR
jgi:hypothetical protein